MSCNYQRKVDRTIKKNVVASCLAAGQVFLKYSMTGSETEKFI